MTLILREVALDGTITERPFTEEETAQHNAEALVFEEAKAVALQAKTEKEAARQAVLDKLGLTAEEVAALLS
jgi:hypothetical protein